MSKSGKTIRELERLALLYAITDRDAMAEGAIGAEREIARLEAADFRAMLKRRYGQRHPHDELHRVSGKPVDILVAATRNS